MAQANRVAIALSVLALSCTDGGRPATAETSRSIDFSTNPNPVTLSQDGVEVTLQPIFDGESDVEVVTSIRADGFQSIITREGVATSSSYIREVSVGKLSNTDPIPSVLLGGYTGGAHCCATLQAIVPSAGKLKVIDFEPVDGEPNSLFPRDVDGDGTIDFIRQDDSFRYAFSSGAGSFSPPVIFNIYRGNLINVSDQPAYRQLWLSFAAETFKVCSDRADEDRNGACIAYAAAGARLGEFPTYLNRAVKNSVSGSDVQLPEGCKTELVAYACPSGSEIKFFTFESAANWFLRKNGYIN